MHWLAHFFGFSAGDGNGSPYLFWSGAGSDMAYIGVLIAILRRYNCHQPRCLRLGRFPVKGTAWKACRHHHPEPPRHRTIREEYHLYVGKQPGKG